jgi:hypothetical protein
MLLVFDFPDDYVLSLLRDWIDMKTLVRVDSASCSCTSRSSYMAIISCELFVVDRMYWTFHTQEANLRHLEWLANRGIRAGVWRFAIYVPAVLLVDLVGRTGGDHVHTLELHDVGEETAGLFAIVFHECRCIAAISVDICEHWTGISALDGSAQNSLQKLLVTNCGSSARTTFTRNCFPNLQQLFMDGNCGASIMASLLHASSGLLDLRLKSSFVDDVGLFALRTHAEKLHTLALTWCDSITNGAVVALAKNCVSLTCLDLSQCRLVRDDAVRAFAAASHMLESVQLRDNFTEASVQYLAMQCGPTLHHLALDSVTFSSDEALIAVVEKCTNLIELRLEALNGISTECYEQIASSLPCLEELALQGCPLTDAVLIAVATHLPALKALSLCHTAGYTNVGALAVVASLTQLRKFAVDDESQVFNPLALSIWKAFVPALKVCDYFECYTSKFEDLRGW